MKNRSDLPIQTLRLSERDKAKLLWAIEQANRKDAGAQARGLRISCTHNEAVLTLKSEGGSDAKLAVLIRNLSRHGVALVHGRYVHADSQCVVNLTSKTGMAYELVGTVRHIRHIQGTIHELGVEFKEPIDLSEFVEMSQAEETQYMRELADEIPEPVDNDVDPMVRQILIMDDFSCDRKLFSHWLTQAGMAVSTSVDARSTRVQIHEQVFDLLVIDCNASADGGADLIRELREDQVVAPIIAVSADDSPAIQAAALSAGANRFLSKPFSQPQLVETANELLGINADNDVTPILSSHLSDPQMRPLLTEFTRKLTGYIDDLREANAQTNYDTISKLSRQLRGAGEGYGFPQISELAGVLLEEMDQDAAEVESIRQATNDLIATLNRVKLS